MLETTIIEVSEDERNKTIQEYQSFGWQVLNSQKVDYTTTYKTGGGNAKQGYYYTVHNDRTSYYSITFQRDSKNVNKKLRTLFDDYKRNKDEIEEYNKKIEEANSAKKTNSLTILFGACFIPIVIGIVMIIIGSKNNKSCNQIIEQSHNEIQKLEGKNKKLMKEAKAINDLIEEDDYIEDEPIETELIDDDDSIEI